MFILTAMPLICIKARIVQTCPRMQVENAAVNIHLVFPDQKTTIACKTELHWFATIMGLDLIVEDSNFIWKLDF